MQLCNIAPLATSRYPKPCFVLRFSIFKRIAKPRCEHLAKLCQCIRTRYRHFAKLEPLRPFRMIRETCKLRCFAMIGILCQLGVLRDSLQNLLTNWNVWIPELECLRYASLNSGRSSGSQCPRFIPKRFARLCCFSSKMQ